MFGSDTLDVAIGVVFVYLLLSLICSSLKELIEAMLKKRARDLEQGIRQLLGNDGGLVWKLYNHPLIDGRFQGPPPTPAAAADAAKPTESGQTEKLPTSYIPPRNFALALMDVIRPAAQNRPSGAAFAVAAAALTSGDETDEAPAPQLGGSPTKAFLDLRKSIEEIQNPAVRQALLTLMDAAGGDIEQARANIESWFDRAMERVSGAYKRWSQFIIFVLALLVTLAANADTLAMVNGLSGDRKMREALVNAATQVTAAQEKLKNQQAGAAGDVRPSAERLRENVEELQKLRATAGGGLPVGWRTADFWQEVRQGLPLNLVGWLLTVVAISLGAPFWFDLLNRFMNVRAAHKPRDQRT
jgi:hypothetical protein